jgi:hypothetical protein
MAKQIAHYELYKMIADLPGSILEMGVFKGASLMRWTKFRSILETSYSRKIVGFDTFGEFPEATAVDHKTKEKFTSKAGKMSASLDEMNLILDKLNLNENIELVEGDILQTLDSYLMNNPAEIVSLVHVDVDLFNVTEHVLNKIWPLLVKGGVVVLDDYSYFPGANLAINNFIIDNNLEIRKFRYTHTPSYIIKT